MFLHSALSSPLDRSKHFTQDCISDLSKDCVFVDELGRSGQCEEELAAVVIGAAICHRQ